MLLFDIGAILFCIGLMLNICFRIFPPKYVRDLNKTQKTGCFVLLTILSMIGGIVMIIVHYVVAGIPEAISLW